MLKIGILLLLLQGTLMAIEEPHYQVIEKNDTYEIRTYDAYIVAQTEVSGTFYEMGTKAFKILFNYISGGNQTRSNIKMTAPVIQEKSQNSGQKIKMTAPVIQEVTTNTPQKAKYSFVMPKEFTLDTLPLPRDKRIQLIEIPSKTVAVLMYSGGWGEKKYKKHEAILLNSLKRSGITPIGQANFARYNSPFALWFMRRNEIMIEIKR